MPSALPTRSQTAQSTQAIASIRVFLSRLVWLSANIFSQMVALGDCGCTGGIYGESYASCGRVSNVIPVDVCVPGCPPTPLAIMQGILTAISVKA